MANKVPGRATKAITPASSDGPLYRVTPISDIRHSEFTTGSPDEPLHLAPVAREDHSFLAMSRRHGNGIDNVPRSGQPIVRLALTERNNDATSQEALELDLF